MTGIVRNRKEHAQELSVADLRRIVHNLNGFSVAGFSSADAFVLGGLGRSAGVAGGCVDHAFHVLEDGLNINIDLRSDSVELEGSARDVARAEQVFADYDHLQRSGHAFNNGDLGSMLRVLLADPKVTLRGLAEAGREGEACRPLAQVFEMLEAISKVLFGMVNMVMKAVTEP